MTKQDAIQDFKDNILPTLDHTDKPLVRMTWNDYVDRLQRHGAITEKQASTWEQPKFVSRGLK